MDEDRGSGSPTTGNSRTRGGSMRNVAKLIPITPTKPSAITGGQAISLPRGSGTGTPRGEPGAVANARTLTDLAALARSTDEERISKEAMAALLRRCLGSSPVEVWRDAFDTDGQYDPVLDKIDLPICSAATLAAAWQHVQLLCVPARADPKAERAILEEWARTVSVTASRADKGHDAELAADTIADELIKYPVDCVLRALRGWRAGHKWRPTLAEILGDVQWRARRRQCIREAFERAGVA